MREQFSCKRPFVAVRLMTFEQDANEVDPSNKTQFLLPGIIHIQKSKQYKIYLI